MMDAAPELLRTVGVSDAFQWEIAERGRNRAKAALQLKPCP
jgi:hypothetical protein